MDYYIYENWTHDRARVHAASCGFCNNGLGMHSEDSGANGRWLGPFPDCPSALAAARDLHRADTRACTNCVADSAMSGSAPARPDPRTIIVGTAKVSDRIRALAKAGYSRNEIAKLIDRSYQQVRQVLVDDERRRERRAPPVISRGVREDSAPFTGAVPSLGVQIDRVVIDDERRLVLTPALIEALDARPGEWVTAFAAPDGTVALLSGRRAMQQAQAIVRAFVPEGVSLVDELLAERRGEVERESRSD